MLDKPQVLHKEVFRLDKNLVLSLSCFWTYNMMPHIFAPRPPHTKGTAGGALPPSTPTSS